MAKAQEKRSGKRVERSRRRARPSVLGILLILLIALLSWLLGLRPGDFLGGGKSGRRDQKEPAHRLGSSLRQGLVGSRGADQDVGEGNPFRLTSWREAARELSDAGEPSPLAEGGLFSGPAWLRLRVPRNVALEDIRVRVEAVHAAMPGLRGRRWLRAERREEPDLILLQVDTAPGGLWIEIGVDDAYFAHFLSGPHEVAPWSFVDLGRMSGLDDLPEVVPGLRNVIIRPQRLTPPGRERAIWSSYELDGGEIPRDAITRRLTELDWVPRFFGLYQVVARPRVEARPTSIDNPEVESPIRSLTLVTPEHTWGIRTLAGGSVDELLGRYTSLEGDDPDILYSGGMRTKWEANHASSGMGSQSYYSAQVGLRLRMAPEIARRVRALHISLCEDRRRIADRLALETLLFQPERPTDSKAAPGSLEYALLPGRYRLFDLERLDPDGVPMMLGEIEGREHGEVISWSPPEELPTRLVAARVVDAETGDPIAGAEIVIGRDLEAWAVAAQLPSKLVTDAEGRFVARGLPEGELDLLVQASGYEPRRAQGTVGLDEEAPVTIALERAAGLEVRVRNPEGAPLVVDGVVAIGRKGHRAQVTLDSDGRARFAGLSPDHYVLMPFIGSVPPSLDDWHWLERESGGIVIDHPRQDENPITFVLPRPVPVTLDIETTGPAPAIFILHIQHGQTPPAPGLWPRLRFEDVMLGTLAVDSLPPGRYRVVAETPGGGAVGEIDVPDRPNAVIPLTLDFD